MHVSGSAASSLPPIYEVVLEEPESAIALRKAYSNFKSSASRKKPVPCQAELVGVGVFNSVTLATRVRISILRVGTFPFSRCSKSILVFTACPFPFWPYFLVLDVPAFLSLMVCSVCFSSQLSSGTGEPTQTVSLLCRLSMLGRAFASSLLTSSLSPTGSTGSSRPSSPWTPSARLGSSPLISR